MSNSEIIQHALQLPERERAELAAMIIDSLKASEQIDDHFLAEETERRDLEIENGIEHEISHEELISGVKFKQ